MAVVDPITTYSFGEWMKQRRKQLRLTQRAVAASAFCSVGMIKKIEGDERRPSPELAGSLAEALQIPAEQQELFIAYARGERPIDLLSHPLPGPEPLTADSFGRLELPTPATPFIGRKGELSEILDCVNNPACRLLTLSGPGGVGKTRLALEAARIYQTDAPGAVVFVALASVQDHKQIANAAAAALHTPLVGSTDPDKELGRILRRRELLMVLDNFEQVVEGAPLLAQWLAAAPGLSLLVTSRERLNLQEEWLISLEGFDAGAAEELFVQTAKRIRREFSEGQDHFLIQEICKYVDGLPLAVELAATWVTYLSLDQIAARLRQDLDFLTSRMRDATERQRSLRAVFNHSWELLDEDEQHALAALSVFRGGFDEKMAETVSGASLPMLLNLVDKSLVRALGEGRFDLHEVIRRYALKELEAAEGVKAAGKGHLAAMTSLVDSQMKDSSSDSALHFDRLEVDHDNILAALQWGEANGEILAALRLASAVYPFWLRRGYWPRMAGWHKRLIAKAGDIDDPFLCLCLLQLGTYSILTGDYNAAQSCLGRAIPMAHRLEEPLPLAFALASEAMSNTDLEKAKKLFARALAICREHQHEPGFTEFAGVGRRLFGDRLMNLGKLEEASEQYRASVVLLKESGSSDTLPYALGNLGRIALKAGNLQDAYEKLAESVAIAREGRHRAPLADWLFRLGLIQLYRGELTIAGLCLNESLELYYEFGNRKSMADVQTALAEVALATGDDSQAASRLGQAFETYGVITGQADEASLQMLTNSGDFQDAIMRALLLAVNRSQMLEAAKLLGFTAALKAGGSYTPDFPLESKCAAAQMEVEQALPVEAMAAAHREGKSFTLAEAIEYVQRLSEE